MTIEDAMGPLLLPVAIAVAIVAVAALCRHVARRYPSAPKRLPGGVGIDGRPGRQVARGWLWVPPSVLVAVTTLLCVVFVRRPPPADSVVPIALVFIVIAEVAWLLIWTTDRQIEFARGMIFRVAPARLLRVIAPLLVTIAVTLFLAIRPAS